jgi:hypothetical protein
MASSRSMIGVLATSGPASALLTTGWAAVAVRTFSAIGEVQHSALAVRVLARQQHHEEIT